MICYTYLNFNAVSIFSVLIAKTIDWITKLNLRMYLNESLNIFPEVIKNQWRNRILLICKCCISNVFEQLLMFFAYNRFLNSSINFYKKTEDTCSWISLRHPPSKRHPHSTPTFNMNPMWPARDMPIKKFRTKFQMQSKMQEYCLICSPNDL